MERDARTSYSDALKNENECAVILARILGSHLTEFVDELNRLQQENDITIPEEMVARVIRDIRPDVYRMGGRNLYINARLMDVQGNRRC